MSQLAAPSSIFSVRPGQSTAGKPSIDIWVVAPSGSAFRGVVSAAIEITLDPKDASFDVSGFKYALNWTGLAGGSVSVADGQYRIIGALFNSTEISLSQQVAASASVNETQRVTMPSWFSSGSFTLSYTIGGKEVFTDPISAGATASVVQEKLNLALGQAGSVTVASATVSQVASAYDITFGGALKNTDVPELSAQLYVNPVLQNGEQLLASFALEPAQGTSAVHPIQVNIDEFEDALGFTYKQGYTLVDGYALPLEAVNRVVGPTAQLGSANELDGSGFEKALLLGFGGNDVGSKLAAGDTFVGGDGVDTAKTADAGPYTVKLVSPQLMQSLQASATSAAADLSSAGDPVGSMQPMYALQKASGAPIFVEAEFVQIGTAAAVDPARLLNGGVGVKLVGGADPAAFESVKAAVAAAAPGDLIVVAVDHFEPEDPVISVSVNNLRVVLQNTRADPLDFVLADVSGVGEFALMGAGLANVMGNSQPNVLIGNFADNSIFGGGGDDVIIGGDGDDVIHGGAGNDLLSGDDGWDTVLGGSGSDVLVAAGGGVVAPGSSALTDPSDVDVVDGGSGRDLLLLGGSSSLSEIRAVGGSGADVFRLVSGNGYDSPSSPEPQAYRAFIGDLSSEDGIDLSAVRKNSSGSELLGDIASLPSTSKPFSSGDLGLSLAGLFVQGLQAPAASGTARPAAPVDSVSTGSTLGAAFPGVSTSSAAETVFKAAIARVATLSAAATDPYSKSTQQIIDSLPASIQAYDALLDSLYYGL